MSEIRPVSFNMFSSIAYQIDYEYMRIIRKLAEYGLRPTGNKEHDRETLRKKELEEAKRAPCVLNGFITVSKNEQEKIQEKKKQKRIENNPKQYKDTAQGQQILGEQLILAIEMKKKKEMLIKKKEDDKKL